MVHVISGRYKGLTLEAPEGEGTRPTLQRIKENVFNILQHAPWNRPWDEVRVLDLFAGTGQLGIEVLSRGGKRGCFVEHDVAVRGVLRRNIERIQGEGMTKVYSRSALDMEKMPPQSGGPFNLVFVDAPYGKGWAMEGFLSAANHGWLEPSGCACLEMAEEEQLTLPAPFEVVDTRVYGSCQVVFIQWTSL